GCAQPGAPEANRGCDAPLGFFEVLGDGQAVGPGERAVRAVPGVENMAAADAVSLDPEGEIRLESEGLGGSAPAGRVAIAGLHAPFGPSPAVVECRLADELDLHLSLEAFDRADEHVVGVVVGRRAGVRRDL